MLFRNKKTGNIVAATSETSIELMQRSAVYEAVETAPAPAPAAKTAKKSAAKAKTEMQDD